MSSSQIVAAKFEDIGRRMAPSTRPKECSHTDRVIWYVIAVRCEFDMEGLASVFDQLLTEDELLFFIASLDGLAEPVLADHFRKAHLALRRVGFYAVPDSSCQQFGQALLSELTAIESALQAEQRLWSLDDKLLGLVGDGESHAGHGN